MQFAERKRTNKPSSFPPIGKTIMSNSRFGSKAKLFYSDGGTLHNGLFGHQSSLIVITNGMGEVLCEQDVGDKTNNETELLALIWALGHVKGPAVICSDSVLAINLITGKYKTKIDRLLTLAQIGKMLFDPEKVALTWIPREENKAGWYIEEKYGL